MGELSMIDVKEMKQKGAWFALPLEIRERFWKETDYGKKEPSAELKAIMIAKGYQFVKEPESCSTLDKK